MIFDKNWEDIDEKVALLKRDSNELKRKIDEMVLKYEEATTHYGNSCNKIRVVLAQCCDYEQRLTGIPERNREIREAFDGSDGILHYLGLLLDYEKNQLKKDDSSRDIHFHFYTDIVSVLSIKLNTLARQLDELQKCYQKFDKEGYQELLLQNVGGMPDGRVDSQFLMKAERIKNQINKLLREINRKYQKKGLHIYHQYTLSEDTSRLRKLKRQAEDMPLNLMLLESKVEETDKILASLEKIHEQQELNLKGDSADMQYGNVYDKLRLVFTHNQLSRLNSAGYTTIEYTQLVRTFCNRVRDALSAQNIRA